MSTQAFDRWCARLGRMLLLALPFLLLLGLSEGLARLLHQPEPVRRVYDPFAYRIPQPLLVDDVVGPNKTRTTTRLNELGMRGPSIHEPLAPDTLTLLFLGGSTTENYPYPRADTFPEILGRALARRLERPVRVMNAAASGATSGSSLGRLQHQGLGLDPDLVVVMHGINDLLAGFHPDFRSDSRHFPRPAIGTERPRSWLLDWLRQRRQPDRAPARPDARPRTRYDTFPARTVFARNLRSMTAISLAHGVPILVLTQATGYQKLPAPNDAERFVMATRTLGHLTPVPDIPSLARGMAAFNRVVLELEATFPAATDGPHVFDLATHLPHTDELFVDECHFTLAGNRRVAQALEPVLARILARAPLP